MARDSSDASLPPLLWAFASADARGNGSWAGAAWRIMGDYFSDYNLWLCP
ncbi:hypothetical protein [Azospirillum palustre]